MADAANYAAFDDRRLVEEVKGGNEAAFEALLLRYNAALLRLAMIYVPSRAVAEEVAQETWIAVLRGLEKFEGRSSFKTWLFSILMNRAKTVAAREGRYVGFPEKIEDEAQPSVAPERFNPADHPRWAHHWAEEPYNWGDLPEEKLLSKETLQYVANAIARLPENQRIVITLRDVEGWSAEEVCNALAISETNQRVLLHRARSKVRQSLEEYLRP